MSRNLPERLQQIINTGRIRADDTLAIRRTIYPDGHVGADEADWLFELNAACLVQDQAWHTLFVEAITDFVVNQMPPQGYVSAENAAWLMARIDHDGRVNSITELELMVAILDQSTSCPEAFSAYVLEQVRQAVLTGQGPLRAGRRLEPGRVTSGDVDLMRRTLYAAGGQQHIAISRAEAAVLFDISDATAGADNDPAWTDLFIKAVANHMMFASGYTVPSREEALRRDEWVNDTSVEVVGFFARMARGLKDVMSLYHHGDEGDAGLDRQSADIAINERVTEEEARWLADRITRDGRVLTHEAALLSFIKHESPDIHPVLRPLLDKVA